MACGHTQPSNDRHLTSPPHNRRQLPLTYVGGGALNLARTELRQTQHAHTEPTLTIVDVPIATLIARDRAECRHASPVDGRTGRRPAVRGSADASAGSYGTEPSASPTRGEPLDCDILARVGVTAVCGSSPPRASPSDRKVHLTLSTAEFITGGVRCGVCATH